MDKLNISSILWLALIGALIAAVLVSISKRFSLLKAEQAPLIGHKVLRKPEQSAKLRLLEEDLAISKHWIKTGDVTMRREVIHEEKTIVVPITREELIIEKTTLAPDSTPDELPQIIRIPLTEERAEVVKHTVVLNDVDIYTRQFTDKAQIDATLKKEKLQVIKQGHPNIRDKN